MSRVSHSIKNIFANTAGQVLTLVLGFASRSVFLATLGEQYLGVSGLFSNIIMMLSLTELGIGSAIVFNLYKPIAQKDQRRIYVLMKFYRSAYLIIGLSILVIGGALIPLLPYLIKDPPGFLNLPVIYIVYLIQSVSSYLFFAYKRSLLNADQKTYVATVIGYFFTVGTSVLQIVCLYLFKNFYVYLLLGVFMNLVMNLTVARKVDRMYPYINEKTPERLSKAEIVAIIKDCYAISLGKINFVVLNATNNLVLSKFIGLAIVGLYSNYTLITAQMKNFLNIFYNSILSSLGNLHASSDAEHEYRIFKVVNLAVYILFGTAATGILATANPFIEAWIGEKYLLPQAFVLLLALDFYIYGVSKVTGTFRTSMGLFQQAKYRPLFGSVLNLAISIALVKPLGISGVLLGTIIATGLTYFTVDPIVLFKHGFKRSSLSYYMSNLAYLAVTVCSCAGAYGVSLILPFRGWGYVIVTGLASVLLPVLLSLLFFRRTEEYKYIYRLVSVSLEKIKGKLSA